MAKKMYLEDRRPVFLVVLEHMVQIALVSAVGLFIARYLFFSCSTESKSMEPTIVPDSVVFTDRLAYIFNDPERFDVVSFRRAGEEDGNVLIRRIVALPGETVLISRGVVYINGEVLDVSAYISEITSDGIAGEEFRLGEDEYFVLGDTPANSEDSRSSTIGNVRRSLIIGKAFLSSTTITDFSRVR